MKRIVFCDFDGTITAKETMDAVLKRFAPEISAQLIPQMYARQLTLRQGVRQILESIPSGLYPKMIEFTKSQSIRPGFIELLDWLESEQVPIVVISGGLRGMVEVVLASLLPRIHAIHTVDVDTNGSHLRVLSEYEGGTELVNKVQVMSQYQADEKIAIGDSITDLNMALETPVVFARDRLAEYLDQHQKPYIPWNDFFDVRDRLKQL